MKDGWKHLYGVTTSCGALNFGPIRVGNQDDEVYSIIHEELAAIVSSDSSMDFKTMPKDLVIRHLLDHQKVIERVMALNSIIPFKFGSLAQSEKEVEQILTEGYTLFKSLLPWIRERVEVELVAKWNRELVFKTLYDEESEIRCLQKLIEKQSEANTFLEKITLGKLVRQCLSKKEVLFREKILSHLKGCAESLSNHEVMDDLMILNAAFLLRKGLEKEFDRRVEYLDHTFSGEVCFKLIGPLPLYSFKCLEIEWADATEIRKALSVLGLKENASFADLKSAYYQKAQSFHPDKTGTQLNGTSDFEEVVEAHRFLERYYRLYHSTPQGNRIPLIKVKTNESNN